MTLEALYPLADRAALFAALRREALNTATAALGEHRWDVDLEAGTVTFSAVADPARRLVASAELVATLAPASGSILWGWAHPQGKSEGPVAKLRTHGEEAGIGLLSQAEVPFPPTATLQPDTWIDDTAFVIGLAATEITGAAPAFVAPVEGGTRAVFLLDAGLPPLTVAGAFGALPHILSTTPLRDGRTSAWGLARLAGWQFEWADAAYSGARVSDASGHATFHFDESARIIGFQPGA